MFGSKGKTADSAAFLLPDRAGVDDGKLFPCIPVKVNEIAFFPVRAKEFVRAFFFPTYSDYGKAGAFHLQFVVQTGLRFGKGERCVRFASFLVAMQVFACVKPCHHSPTAANFDMDFVGIVRYPVLFVDEREIGHRAVFTETDDFHIFVS